MKKDKDKEPKKEDFGWYDSTSFEEESGWQIEGGEEAYMEAMREWRKRQNEKLNDSSKNII